MVALCSDMLVLGWRGGCARVPQINGNEVVARVRRMNDDENGIGVAAVVAHFVSHAGGHAAERAGRERHAAVTLLSFVGNVDPSLNADEKIIDAAVEVRRNET